MTTRACRKCGQPLTPREFTEIDPPGYCLNCAVECLEDRIDAALESQGKTREKDKSERTAPVLPRGKPAQIDATGHAIPQHSSPEPPWGREILELDTYAWPAKGDKTEVFTAEDAYNWFGPPDEGTVRVNVPGSFASHSGICPGCGSLLHTTRKYIFCPVCGCQNTLG